MSRILYYNGIIHPLQGREPVQALGIEEGRIRAMGSEEDLADWRTADTCLVNLEGRTMLPAFIDAHSHLTALANTLQCVSLQDAGSFAEIQKRLQEYIAGRKPADGEWIIGVGYDHNSLKEQRHPTRRMLDAIAQDHPIVISHASGHMGVVNSAALAQAGIDESSADPAGGVIGREEDGRTPNGYLEEKAFLALAAHTPRITPERQRELLREAQRVYSRYGITTVQDGLTGEAEMAWLDQAAKPGDLFLDVVAYADLKNAPSLLQQYPAYRQRYHRGLKLGGYKIILDGSPQGRTAWMTTPYEPGPDQPADYCGYPIYSDGEVRGFIERALRENTQLLVHCNGDAAAEQMIRCMQAALRTVGGRPDTRPVMIHAQLVRKDQLERMRDCGILPSFFVAHTYYWGDVHRRNFGAARADRISPVGTAARLGIPYTFHQDTPVLPPDMLKTVWCAVNRKTREGIALDPTERVSVGEALYGVTAGGAFSYFEEAEKGTLEIGKRADLVILDRDPFAVDPAALDQIRVETTIKDGKVIYERAAEGS